MQPHARRTVRYDDFVARPRRRWPWVVAVVMLIAILGAAAAFFLPGSSQSYSAPVALSRAGAPVADERYQWKHVAIGGGGMISGLSSDAAGQTLVARSDVYGAYIWDKGANRWAQLVTAATMPDTARAQNGAAAGVYEIVVAPSRPGRIYMALQGRVYRSDDTGRHWMQPHAGNPFPLIWDANSEFRLHGPFMAVDPANPDVVLLGTPGTGLWRSTDAGASWDRISSIPVSKDRSPNAGAQAPGTMLWFERPAGGKPTGRLFALSSGNGMFVSADGGATFHALPASGAQPLTLQRGAFDRRGTFFGVDDVTKSIWSYRDGRWRDLTAELNLTVREYAAVAANPRADQVIVVDRGGKGYVSTDGGENWSSVTHSSAVGAGDPPWLRVANSPFFTTADLMFDAAVPNRLWVGAGMGVFYADVPPGTAALDWVSQTRGIEELVANDVIQPAGGSPIFAAWDFGIHVKDDLNAYSSTFAPGERTLMSVQQLDWTPAKPGFVVTNASDARTCCAEDGNAVMAGTSSDGGRTWRKFASLPTPPGTKADDPWRMSFGTIAVSSSDPRSIVWAPARNRQPFVTHDGGANWEAVRLSGAVGDTPGSFEHTWLQRKTVTADKAAPGTFYFYHSGEGANAALQGLWRSQDDGRSWSKVFNGEIAPVSNMAAKLRSVPGHAGHLFFTSGFEHTGDTGLRRSRDGGATWQVVADVTRVDDIAFGKAAKGARYPTIFVSGRIGGEYGIWRSVDDAQTWQRLIDFPAGTLDQVSVVGADPDVFGRVYLGYVGSGWIWGEPAPCTPAPLGARNDTQCVAVR
ncbi:hypothetical protein KZ810_10840 [Sphingomonas sp. RHCKR47]|uniref:sialidase family protein n=1 Tax=Sphingomonas citricola TaxID=2862498 RepID=UPI001CA5CBA4|nr:sialidase family protein [Sphingomonas citricola]MBW6523991.1 hypothetical protein [Sphingomonas citricola]